MQISSDLWHLCLDNIDKKNEINVLIGRLRDIPVHVFGRAFIYDPIVNMAYCSPIYLKMNWPYF